MSTAFGIVNEELAVFDIPGFQLQDLTSPHSAPGHQFQNQKVSGFADSENDFVNDILFQNGPLSSIWKPKSFPEHLGITRIGNDVVDVGSDEIEKCLEEDEFETFGALLLSFAVLDQKGQDIL